MAQALGPPSGAKGYDEDRMRYRVLTVSADGTVADDVFSYAERCTPAIRTWAIDGVVPHPIGCQSDLMQVWPTLWYPILYPWLTGLVGALMLAMCCLRRGRGIQHGV